MSISSLYDTAKQYADKIMLEQPSFFSGSGGSLTLIADENEEIIFGITSIRIADGRIITVPSEYNAIASMAIENKKKAVEMVTISFYDYSVTTPSAYCLNLLLRAGAENSSCQIAVSTEESISANELKEQFLAEQAQTDENDIPSEFMDGFDFGAGNPFDATEFDSEPEISEYSEPVPETEYQQPVQNQPYMQPNPQTAPFPNPYPNQPYAPNPQFPNQPYQPYGYPQQPYMPNQPYAPNPQFPNQPYQPYGYPQQPYMPNQPYGYPMYSQQPNQSMYLENANPYNVNPQGSVQTSVPLSDTGVPKYNNETEQNIMKKKLASLIGEDMNAPEEKEETAPEPLSKEEMLRRMNQEKRSAKGGFFGKKS